MFILRPVSLFYGKDIFMDFINVVVLSFILFYVIKFYKINKKKYRTILASFLLLTMSFIAKIFSHFIIYYNDVKQRDVGIITFTYQTISQSHALIFYGIMIYRILTIFGLYLFYISHNPEQKKEYIFFVSYLLLIVSYLGHLHFILYHITVMFLISIIIIQLVKTYKFRKKNIQKNIKVNKKNIKQIIFLLNQKIKNKLNGSRKLILAFFLLFISQGIFIFMMLDPLVYFAGEIFQLVSYLIILFTFYKVIRNAKKR